MKKNRHEKIKELIRERGVETQEELADYLRAAGYDVTQATVSRDIRELQLYKMAGTDGRLVYAFLAPYDGQLEEKYTSVLRNGFISAETAENILVIKTVAGMAMAVAAALDAMRFPEVVGCIAGDDTIMVAVKNAQAAVTVRDRIYDICAEWGNIAT